MRIRSLGTWQTSLTSEGARLQPCRKSSIHSPRRCPILSSRTAKGGDFDFTAVMVSERTRRVTRVRSRTTLCLLLTLTCEGARLQPWRTVSIKQARRVPILSRLQRRVGILTRTTRGPHLHNPNAVRSGFGSADSTTSTFGARRRRSRRFVIFTAIPSGAAS